MKIKDLVHADKISTHTDRKLMDMSLICDLICLVLLTAMLIIKGALDAPILLMIVLLAMAASIAFVISAFYTIAIWLRKKSLKVYLSLALLVISIVLAVLMLAL